MKTVQCPNCHLPFDAGTYLVRAQGALAGMATGAYLGGGVGLIVGPLGALASVVPGALLGGTLGWLGLSKFGRCPSCKTMFPI
jgi:hypothetical protein